MLTSTLGQINLHKGRQQSSPAFSHSGPVTRHSNSSTFQPYHNPYHGRPNGHAGKYSLRSGFRNRSIVTKRGEHTGPHEATNESGSAENSDLAQQHSWVSKRDRHLQLINIAHYDAQSGMPKKTPTQKAEESSPDERSSKERDEATDTLQQKRKVRQAAVDIHRLYVEGIAFHVSDGGSRLVREGLAISSKQQRAHSHSLHTADDTISKPTPESATVGGLQFRSDLDGNLRRMDTGSSRCFGDARILWSPLRNADPSRRPCKRFSNTGISPSPLHNVLSYINRKAP